VKDSLERIRMLGWIAVWFRPVEIRRRSIQHSLPFDFWCLSANGKFIAIEVKETHGRSFPFANIRESQWESFRNISKAESLSVIIVAFKKKRSRIKKWQFIAVNMSLLWRMKNNGLKSVRPEDLLFCRHSRQLKFRKGYGVTEQEKLSNGIDLRPILSIGRPVKKVLCLIRKSKRIRVGVWYD
jgi:hypothetical protein